MCVVDYNHTCLRLTCVCVLLIGTSLMMLLLQVNSYIDRHDVFSMGKYRGDLCLLRFIVSMTINATALYI